MQYPSQDHPILIDDDDFASFNEEDEQIRTSSSSELKRPSNIRENGIKKAKPETPYPLFFQTSSQLLASRKNGTNNNDSPQGNNNNSSTKNSSKGILSSSSSNSNSSISSKQLSSPSKISIHYERNDKDSSKKYNEKDRKNGSPSEKKIKIKMKTKTGPLFSSAPQSSSDSPASDNNNNNNNSNNNNIDSNYQTKPLAERIRPQGKYITFILPCI